MHRSLIAAALFVSLFFLPLAARADDKVNPAYDGWAKFGVGSTVTYEANTDSPQQGHSVMIMSMKLVEKTDDHVVIETAPMTMVIAGKSITMPADRKTIPAAFDPVKDDLKDLGTEDVTAAGQTFSCRVFAPAHATPGIVMDIKLWFCKDVPGGAVKVEVKSSAMHISQLLKSFEAK
jgi:hypothetical protein